MININLLKQLYKINSHSGEEKSLVEFICKYAKENLPGVLIETDNLNNVYMTKGKAKKYPCVVSHTDQVGTYKGKLAIYRSNNVMIAIGEDGKQHNLGADDKNGVWIALQLLKSEPVLKAAFFVGEEIGCVGSSKCDMSFFDDVKFVIQCDRRNGNDLILNAGSVELADSTFIPQDLRKKYGYTSTYGLMTDVQELKRRGLKVACCNMSCGYYNPHTEQEYTDVKELINCYRFVREIIATVDYTPHTYKQINYYNYGYNTPNSANMDLFTGRYYDWDYYDGYYDM